MGKAACFAVPELRFLVRIKAIFALVKDGYRIGVTSNSHRAISLLLQEAGRACREGKIAFTGASVNGQEDEVPDLDGFEKVATGAELLARSVLPQIVGGTAWVFSREDAEGRFDFLFVDEAGQVSVANLVGMAASARNFVLLGDQRQLNQPRSRLPSRRKWVLDSRVPVGRHTHRSS